MPRNLSIFLLFICLFGFLEIFRLVKKKRMIFKQALFWTILDILLVLSIIFVKKLRFIADLIGIEKISNMIFLFGFLVVLYICVLLSIEVSEHKNKIIVLTQKIGILENEIREKENEKNNNKQ